MNYLTKLGDFPCPYGTCEFTQIGQYSYSRQLCGACRFEYLMAYKGTIPSKVTSYEHSEKSETAHAAHGAFIRPPVLGSTRYAFIAKLLTALKIWRV